MADNNIEINLDLITKAFDAALREAVKDVEGFGKSFDKAEEGASESLGNVGKAGKKAGDDVAEGAKAGSGAWEVFKGVLGAEAVVGAFNLITDAAKSLFNTFVVEGVKGATEAEASQVKLKAALKGTKEEVDAQFAGFDALAKELQATTKADGDAVLSQVALAKTYGLTNAQAEQVVRTAQDMSAALGIDADTAVNQLSQSFGGQAGRLAKLNPAIKELTEEQIKNGAALSIIAEQYEGKAASALESYDGKTTQLGNTFGDLQEEIGFLITQNPALLDALAQANVLFQDAIEYVSENGDVIKDLIANGITALIEAIKLTVQVGATFITFLQDNATGLKALGVGLATAAVAFGTYVLAMNAGAIATGIATAATTAFNAVLAATPIGLIVVALGALGAGIYYAAENWDLITAKVAGFAGTALQLVIPTINSILDSIRPLVSLFSDDLTAAIDGAKETLAEKADELLALQAEAEAKVDTVKQESRISNQTADANAHTIKVAQVQATAKAEVQAEKQAQTEKATNKTAALVAEAAEQKAADKAKEDADKASKKAAEDAEKDFQRRLDSERKKAAADSAKFEEEYRKAKDKRDDEAFEAQYNREQSLTRAFFAEENKRKSFEESNDREKVANFRSTLGQIASLQSSSSRELFMVGKAAALAEAGIRTYQAANIALASAPPPFNFALAAAVTTAGLLNVQKIATAQPPSAGSFATGGIVGGSSFTGDRLTANVNSREGIFTLQQQKKLFDIATGKEEPTSGSGGAGVLEAIDSLKQAILGQPIVVAIDGEAVATAVRTQVRGGFALGGT